MKRRMIPRLKYTFEDFGATKSITLYPRTGLVTFTRYNGSVYSPIASTYFREAEMIAVTLIKEFV